VYARLSGRQQRDIKRQKYTLRSRRANLSLSGKRARKTLLDANKRLNTAYLPKESFGQLAGVRAYFENDSNEVGTGEYLQGTFPTDEQVIASWSVVLNQSPNQIELIKHPPV
jgi:hypothetical protein